VKTRLLLLLASIILSSAASGIAGAHADDASETLRVCLNENLPPFSARNREGGVGFDLMTAQALAKRLGQTLAVQWYESKFDEDTSATIEANALLSDGRCALVAGYPLMKDALGKPGLESARLPDFAGAQAVDRRRRVALSALAATTPYHFAGLTVVLGGRAKEKRIAGLADLEGMDLTVEAGTLGDTILMSFDHGRFVSRITHVVPERGELFPRLENGDADATLIPVHRFDAYRIEHPDTKLMPSGFYLPIGFNMGFAGLASDSQLFERANAAINVMLGDGELAALAAVAHMTYLPPRQPYILDHLTMSDLAGGERSK
jgi:ABC-type amino acid transport substrate-binding protein